MMSISSQLSPAPRIIQPVDYSDDASVEELVADVKSGVPDRVNQGIKALERTFKGFLTRRFYTARAHLPKLDQDDVSSDFMLAVYQAALAHTSGNRFIDTLAVTVGAALKPIRSHERKHAHTVTFTDVESKVKDGNDDFRLDLQDLHMEQPSDLAVDVERSLAPGVNFRRGLRCTELVHECPIFGASFPPQDHVIYHYGGLLNRQEMIIMDLVQGLTTGQEKSIAEVAEIFGLSTTSMNYSVKQVKTKLSPYEDELREGRVPSPYCLELADPFYPILKKVAKRHGMKFPTKDFKWFELIYPVLPDETQKKIDQMRGTDNDYSIPKGPKQLAVVWKDFIDKGQSVFTIRSTCAREVLRLIRMAQRNHDIDDEDYPYWLIKPSEIKNCFAKLDGQEWTIPNALNYLLPKMGHRPFRDDLAIKAPKTSATVADAARLINIKSRRIQPVDRKEAVRVLTAVLLAEPNKGFGKAMRECPEFFERLMERLSGKKMRIVRRAKELEDLGELTYEKLGNLHRRWCGIVVYQSLVKFAGDYGLNMIAVHSPLDKPRLAREIVKAARILEASNKLTIVELKKIIYRITGHEFSDVTIHNFVDRKGLRLANQPGTHGNRGKGYVTAEDEPEILRQAKALEAEGNLTIKALNDIVFAVTGYRYQNAVSLEPFIAKHRLKVYYNAAEWQQVNMRDTAKEPGGTKPERLNLSRDHKGEIKAEAFELSKQGLLTTRRLNRFVHDISHRSFGKQTGLRKLAEELNLRLVDEPMTILHDIDRGYDKTSALREAALDLGLDYKKMFHVKKPELDWDKILSKLCLEDSPQLDPSVSGDSIVVHLLREALHTTTSTTVGRILRTPSGYKQFEDNLSRLLVRKT